MTPPKAFIFDLDGTLIHSLPDIAESVNRMLDDRGYPRCEEGLFKLMIGDGMAKLVERALPEHARLPEIIQPCVEEYRAHYDLLWREQTRPYDGILEILSTLQSKGFPLGVISNKAHRFTVPMTEYFFGTNLFDHILGQRPEVPHKPDPAGAYEMARLMGLELSDIAYVGDSGIDMAFAVNSGMTGLAVLWGYRSEQELIQNGAQKLVSHPRQILELLF